MFVFKNFIILLSALLLYSCRKDEFHPPPEQEPEKTLLDDLSGVYSGYRYYQKERIECTDYSGGLGLDCQDCIPTNTYDTIFLEVEVIKESDKKIKLIDKYDGYCDHVISMDSSLTFDGYNPVTNAPLNNYKLWFKGENYDSLIIDIVEGGSGACTALTYYYDYILIRN